MTGLGLDLVSKSDQSTGNDVHASYVVQSADVKMIFTAPYKAKQTTTNAALPGYEPAKAVDFFITHGLAVKAVAIEVEDVHDAFNMILSNGGAAALQPVTIVDKEGRGSVDMAEVTT